MDLWYPKAKRWIPTLDKRRDGPGRHYSSPSTVNGIVNHSAEGYVGGLHDVLNSSARVAAWTFSSLYDGTIEQHYPLDAVLWNASSDFAHRNLIGIEHEGGYSPKGEPLRPAQLAASIELCIWIAEQGGFAFSRTGPNKTLWEHNEVADKSAPTACPSGRIPWDKYLAAAQSPPQEEDMQPGYTLVMPEDGNLTAVSKRTGIPVATLAALNGIEDANRVQVGQPLRTNDTLWKPPLFGFSNNPATPNVKALRDQLSIMERQVGLAETALAPMRGAIDIARRDLDRVEGK